MIADSLIEGFSKKLRRLAKQDPLITTAGGVGRYVQAVLVPEVAMRLVMQDMNKDKEEARAILRDSAELGKLLSEEMDEIVPIFDDRHEKGYGEE